jgi:acyl-coenzyme A synthetase/AMP-(fatty) acid ligase
LIVSLSVRMTAAHTIEIMGRIDTQIKYRGVRIEADGVSSILCSAAASSELKVRLEATSLVASHPSIGSEVLVSFVACQNEKLSVVDRRSSVPSPVESEVELVRKLKSAVEVELPVYMRPAYIVPVEFIPLTLNGKMDNKVLARLFGTIDVGTLLRLQGVH